MKPGKNEFFEMYKKHGGRNAPATITLSGCELEQLAELEAERTEAPSSASRTAAAMFAQMIREAQVKQ